MPRLRLRRHDRRGKCGILTENRALELAQLGARLDTELFDEDAPRLAVRLEGFGLPAGAVEGEDELAAEPLSQRLCRDELLQLGDDVGVFAELEPSVDPLLDGGQPQLVQTRALGLDGRLARQVCQRGTSPERQRLAELLVSFARGERPCFGDESLEAA